MDSVPLGARRINVPRVVKIKNRRIYKRKYKK